MQGGFANNNDLDGKIHRTVHVVHVWGSNNETMDNNDRLMNQLSVWNRPIANQSLTVRP